MAAAGQFVRERIPVATTVPEAGRLLLELVGSSSDSQAESAGPMTFRVVRRYRPTWATATAFLVFPLFVRKTDVCRIAVIEARAGAEVLIEGHLDPALHSALLQLGRVPEAARVATLGPRPVPQVLAQQAAIRPPAPVQPSPFPPMAPAPAASPFPGPPPAAPPPPAPFAHPLGEREPLPADAGGSGPGPTFRPLEPAPPVGGNGNGHATHGAPGTPAPAAQQPSWAFGPGLDSMPSGRQSPPEPAPSAPHSPPAAPQSPAAPASLLPAPDRPWAAPPGPPAHGGPAAGTPGTSQPPQGRDVPPTSAMPPRPLEIEVSVDSGETSVVGALLLVGRAPSRAEHESHAKLLTVNDPSLSVSKTHLAIGVDPAGLWVVDRRSTNGTWLDEGQGELQRVEPGVRTAVPGNARVLIGERVLTFTRKG